METASTRSSTHQAPAATATDRPLIYVNGEMLPKRDAVVNVFDHGLLYGDGVFEGIRIYRGRIFKCEQHMDRLYECAEAIHLHLSKFVSREEMVAIMRRCVEANELTDGYIRLVVTRGVGTLGLNPYLCPEPGVICIADQIRLYPEEMYTNGMRVLVANRPKTPIECLDPRIKSLNYLNNILAKVEALDQGCFEVLMLNTEGKLSEGSGDNVFIVKDGTVYTPPSSAGILHGITRRFVKDELCPQLGYTCIEKNMTLDDVFSADELFLTGTAAEIIAVKQVDQHLDGEITNSVTISDGEGPITAALRARFRQIVTSDNVPED